MSAVAFAIDGGTSRLHAIDLSDKTDLRTLDLESEPNYLSLSSQGVLLVATDDGATLIDGTTFDVLAEIPTEVAVYSAVFSPDDNFIALGASDDGKVYLHEASSPFVRLAEGTSDCSATYFVAFSPSSTILASGTDRGTTFIWSIPTLELIRTLVGHSHYVVPGTFLSESLLVTGSWDNTCRVWDVSNGECVKVLAEFYTDRVRWVATSPDYSMFASACDDKAVRLYNAQTLSLIKSIALQDHVTRLCFVDCSCILAGVANAGLQIIDLESGTAMTISPLQIPRGIAVTSPRILFLPPIVI